MKNKILLAFSLAFFNLNNCMNLDSLENIGQQVADFLRKNKESIAIASGLLAFKYLPTAAAQKELKELLPDRTESTLTFQQYSFQPVNDQYVRYSYLSYPVARIISSTPNNNQLIYKLLYYGIKLGMGVGVYHLIKSIKF